MSYVYSQGRESLDGRDRRVKVSVTGSRRRLEVHIKTSTAESCWTDCLASVTSSTDWTGLTGKAATLFVSK
jgi:hypothetical protein